MDPIVAIIGLLAAFGAGLSFGLSWNRPIKRINENLNSDYDGW